jgi:hypothetical protein
LGYINFRIEYFAANKNIEIDMLIKELLLIGNSQLDVYIGKLSDAEITAQVMARLNKFSLNSRNRYFDWLNKQGSSFGQIILNDESNWTLLAGNDFDRYVHIHPSRHSAYTIRVRATTLKTVILYAVLGKRHIIEGIDTNFINSIRKKYLNLPPLKSIRLSHGIVKLLGLIEKSTKYE